MEVEREMISIMVEYLPQATESLGDEGSYLRSVFVIGCNARRREQFRI